MDSIVNEQASTEAREKLIIKYLLEWNYDHFVYQRRQSLKTLYDAYLAYHSDSPEAFRTILDAYFRVLKLTYLVQDALAADKDSVVDVVAKLFFTASRRRRSAAKMEEVGGAISRYLESNQDNMGLNFASAIYRLLIGDFENSDGFLRYERFLEAYSSAHSEISDADAGLLTLFGNLNVTNRRHIIQITLNSSERHSLATALHERFGLVEARDFVLNGINRRLGELI